MKQAYLASRRPASGYLAWSERVGIPLATLQHRVPQATIVHKLDGRLKVGATRMSGLTRARHVLAVCSYRQRDALVALGVPAHRIRYVPYTVDEEFFRPGPAAAISDYIVTVGRERRDWNTLAQAVSLVGIRCIVVGSSPWSRSEDGGAQNPLFESKQNLSPEELRDLYAAARVVVVPLQPSNYSAGLTSLREAMAVGRPVIVTDTTGLRGEVLDGINAILVPPGSPEALARKLKDTLGNRSDAEALGLAARRDATQGRTFDQYVNQMVRLMGATQ